MDRQELSFIYLAFSNPIVFIGIAAQPRNPSSFKMSQARLLSYYATLASFQVPGSIPLVVNVLAD